MTCRTRKIKCDEQRPVCLRCRDARKRCEFGTELRWEEEYISKGLAFGRAGVRTKDKGDALSPLITTDQTVGWCTLPTIQPFHFVNHDLDTFKGPSRLGSIYPRTWRSLPEGQSVLWNATLSDDDDQGDRSESPLPTSPEDGDRPSLAPSRCLPLIPQFEQAHYSVLLDYYVQKLCPLTTLSKVSSSPFASLVLPFTILNAGTGILSILALSACHRAKKEPSWRVEAMKLKGQVLRVLQKRLHVEGPEKAASSADTLVTMVILCLYEIINDCDSSWVIHLRGAHDVVRFRKDLRDSYSKGSSNHSATDYLNSGVEVNDLTAFAERFFAFHDVMGRTACGQVPLFGRDYWSFDENVIDVWMGCSSELVALLCSISELSRAALAEPKMSITDTFIHACHVTRCKLEGLEQTVQGDKDDELLVMAAEIKRLAALVYLHCALYNALPTTLFVVELVRQILQLLEGFLWRGFVTGLTWPVFVAAVELDPKRI